MAITTTSSISEKPADPKPADSPANVDTAKDDTIREQTIYIPYEKLKTVFEKQGRGVFLPYEQFQALWKQARAAKAPTPENRPPVGALITEIDSEAVVGKEVVNVTAKLKVEVDVTRAGGGSNVCLDPAARSTQ